MSVLTYSPGAIALSVGGNIITGYADGEVIVVEREVDAMTKVVGADGEVTRVRSSNLSGSLTITLKQDSKSNKVLSDLADLDEQDGSGITDVLLVDNLEYKTFAANGWVRKPPNRTYGTELGNREWILDLDRIRFETPEA